MDPIYPQFAMADPVFYDRPPRTLDAGSEYSPTTARSWSDWENAKDDTWSYWRAPQSVLVEQGWKVHISATPLSAPTVIEHASTYFHDARIPFKVLRGSQNLDRLLSKDADRSSSGKFITAYPPSVEALHEVLIELDALIGGIEAPYILSDLRWRDGPVHVRFGAFVKQTFLRDGVEIHALRNPLTGQLEEDVRSPQFVLPAWAEVPDFLQGHVEELKRSDPPPGFPEVRGVLHHSNAGGVYDATLDSSPIVLKEARPFIGYTPDGRDAVTRLAHEEQVLRALDGNWAPLVIQTHESHGHRFLAMEHVNGQALNRAVVERHPMVRATVSDEELTAYRDWALGVAESLTRAVESLHSAGWTHGDLHPGNVHVRDDGSVTLLDFEMARPVDDRAPALIGAAGFTAPAGRVGRNADLYSLACIRLFLFLPLMPLVRLDSGKATELIGEAARQFGLTEQWQEDLREQLVDSGATLAETSRHTQLRPTAIVEGILADANHERTDRLWAGDPAQFAQPAFAIAHGAAGVMLALHFAGHPEDSRSLRWVERSFQVGGVQDRQGLLDGAAGYVWTMRTLGHHALADAALTRLERADLARVGADFHSGVAGIGLVLLSEAQRGNVSIDRLNDIAKSLDAYWGSRPPASKVATGAGGLLRGATGAALFALRLYEYTGDDGYLRMAERCLEHDLASLARAADGSAQVNEGWRMLPYLGSGSAGIGVVLAQAIRHSSRLQQHREVLDAIVKAACASFVIQAGLFDGRAGLMQFLLVIEQEGLGSESSTLALNRHAEQLALHAVTRPSGLAFAGNALLRVSHDLATGSAGVLATVTAVGDHHAGRSPAWLGIPFLRSAR